MPTWSCLRLSHGARPLSTQTQKNKNKIHKFSRLFWIFQESHSISHEKTDQEETNRFVFLVLGLRQELRRQNCPHRLYRAWQWPNLWCLEAKASKTLNQTRDATSNSGESQFRSSTQRDAWRGMWRILLTKINIFVYKAYFSIIEQTLAYFSIIEQTLA